MSQQRCDIDATVRWSVGREPAARLLELAFAADSVAAAGLVPGDCDVHEALEEVALGRFGSAPGIFQLLVGGEELAGPDQLQAVLEQIKALAGGRP